jgi:hypothetical protein
MGSESGVTDGRQDAGPSGEIAFPRNAGFHSSQRHESYKFYNLDKGVIPKSFC